jgi:preprotein translocase SecE subunit
MAIEVYRPGQGVQARIGAGAALVMLAIFASVRFHQLLPTGRSLAVLGLQVPMSAVWAGGLFVLEIAVIAYFLAGPPFGGTFLRKKSRSLVDLLVDTQAELEKVVWPSRQDLANSTVIVLIAIVLLGVFIVFVDWVVSFVMMRLQVLPG